MYKLESLQENETHEIVWDIEIQRDHLIPAERPDYVLVMKKSKCHLVNFTTLLDHRVITKESEDID